MGLVNGVALVNCMMYAASLAVKNCSHFSFDLQCNFVW